MFVDPAGLELYSKLHVPHQFVDCGEAVRFGVVVFDRSTLGRSISTRSSMSRQPPRVVTTSGHSSYCNLFRLKRKQS